MAKGKFPAAFKAKASAKSGADNDGDDKFIPGMKGKAAPFGKKAAPSGKKGKC